MMGTWCAGFVGVCRERGRGVRCCVCVCLCVAGLLGVGDGCMLGEGGGGAHRSNDGDLVRGALVWWVYVWGRGRDGEEVWCLCWRDVEGIVV